MLPEAPDEIVLDGEGDTDIQGDADVSNASFPLQSVTFMEELDPDFLPYEPYLRGFDLTAAPRDELPEYEVSFEDGEATMEFESDLSPRAHVDPENFGPTGEWRMSIKKIIYSDATDDGYQDPLIVVDEEIEFFTTMAGSTQAENRGTVRATAVIAVPWDTRRSGLGDPFYVTRVADGGGSLDGFSAIEGGWTMNFHGRQNIVEVIEFGMPNGVPVRIDDFGGAVRCTDDINALRKAFTLEPSQLDPEKSRFVYDYPSGDSQPIEHYDRQTFMPLVGDSIHQRAPRGADRVLVAFLLDGGDINRWTDYRCGWVAPHEVNDDALDGAGLASTDTP